MHIISCAVLLGCNILLPQPQVSIGAKQDLPPPHVHEGSYEHEEGLRHVEPLNYWIFIYPVARADEAEVATSIDASSGASDRAPGT